MYIIYGASDGQRIMLASVLCGNCMLQEWQDERLTWNPVDFGNLSDIIVRADKLWLPELAVMNGFVFADSVFHVTLAPRSARHSAKLVCACFCRATPTAYEAILRLTEYQLDL